RLKKTLILAVGATVIGLGSLAASAWVYTDMRREMVRVSTELAQLRLSLDLYVQRSGVAAPATAQAPESQADNQALAALDNRLAILGRNGRGVTAAAEAAPAAVPAVSGPTASTESDGDCLPSGMRLLVAAGDVYPVCGTDASIEVMNVSNG